MRRLAAVVVALCLAVCATVSAAQERPNTILVLDGSGSMWGQIDGINKIVIARDVVDTLLDTFPADQNLGLTVYGHRTRGDCADIETVVPPGAGTLDAIRQAVGGINPRGKTPMTDAVIAAAESLRYTEEAATVILVSDGIETCNPDPCAAARALEQAGIDFTAHVIGFDVTDPDALAQMQCLAEETGGTFRSAANAAELSEALTTVAVAPDPVPQEVTIVAVHQPGGAEIADPIDWKIRMGGDAGEDGTGPGFSLGLMAGDYEVRGIRPADGHEASAAFTVPEAVGPGTLRIEVIFPEPEPDPLTVTFEARIAAEDGTMIADPVIWTLGDAEMTGNPVTMDLAPGSYDVTAYWTAQEVEQTRQFVVGDSARTIALIFEEPLPTATVTGPASAPLGAMVEIGWTGPDEEGDYIAIGQPGARNYVNYTYTEAGSPLMLQMPPEAGSFELRYVRSQGSQVLATAPIKVTPLSVTLTAPESAPISATVEVAWTGPGYDRDYISVAVPGGDKGYVNYTYTNDGSPLMLQMPPEPGDYEIRYQLAQGGEILASVPISVTEAQVSLTAPETATIGQTVEVAWTGPGYDRDYISVAVPGGDKGYVNYTYVNDGSPLMLQMPPGPGDYEIRYQLAQGGEILASVPITIAAAEASLTAPASAEAGTELEVGWTGPGYDRDYIGVSRADDPRGYVNYVYTEVGSPATIRIPAQPGDYELRYFLAQDATILARMPLTVTEATATLDAGGTVALSSGQVMVTWDGPGNSGDYIAIGKPGEDRYVTYAYVEGSGPTPLRLPETAGEWEVRYHLGEDALIIGRAPLTVTAD